MTTDQELQLKPSRGAGVAASGYLLHYCLLDYWIITGVIYELKAHRLVFRTVEQTIAGASEELDSENLLQGVIGMVCKHDKSMHKPVTKDQEQQAAWWFTMNLCISQKYNMRFPTSHVYLWLTKHA